MTWTSSYTKNIATSLEFGVDTLSVNVPLKMFFLDFASRAVFFAILLTEFVSFKEIYNRGFSSSPKSIELFMNFLLLLFYCYQLLFSWTKCIWSSMCWCAGWFKQGTRVCESFIVYAWWFWSKASILYQHNHEKYIKGEFVVLGRILC
jgi:hypothetical protein